MQSIDLHSPLPSTLRLLKNLTTLILSSTNLPVTSQKSGQSLTLINISNNDVLGNIPDELCMLNNFEILSFDSNYIEGSVPLCIVHCDLCCVNCVCFSNKTLFNTRTLYLFVIYNKSIVNVYAYYLSSNVYI